MRLSLVEFSNAQVKAIPQVGYAASAEEVKRDIPGRGLT